MSRPKPLFWIYLSNKMSNIKYLPAALGYFIIVIMLVATTSQSTRIQSQLPFFIAAAILVISIAFLSHWKNFRKLYLVFKNGIEVTGTVQDVYFSRGHGYITSEYQHQQEKYRSTDSVNQNRKTKNITVGQQVLLYVNQKKPTEAFIRDLYLNTF